MGSGSGLSLNEVISKIEKTICVKPKIQYISKRKVDVPVNILDVSRYEAEFGTIKGVDFLSGLKKTADFIQEYYFN